MPNNDIIQLLQAVEKKLSDLESSDSELAKELKETRHQIRDMLSNPDSVPEPDEYFVERLSDIAREFESEHPVLTEWVGRLSDLLSRLGL